MNTISLTYLTPLFIVNGATNYILSKNHEKKVKKSFGNIKTGYVQTIQNGFYIPNEIEDLVIKIEKNIPKKNLYNLYNNLKNVQVKKDVSLLLLGIKGKYNSKQNTLSYSLSNYIEHELIHLASSYYNKEKNFWHSGFINYSSKIFFAKALNEGYTDLITRRIFNKKTKFYDEEVRLVEFIELLFDNTKLQTYYFNNDITAFINTMCKYMNKEEALSFIVSFDLGFDLKKQANPLYKLIYTNLEIRICKIFEEYNKDLEKEKTYRQLLNKTIITKGIIDINNKKIKKRYI